MGTFITSGIYLADRTVLISGNEYCTLIEPGYDAIARGTIQKTSVEEILNLCKTWQKAIRWITFSHAHGDHIGNLPLYLKRSHNIQYLIAHQDCPLFDRLLGVGIIYEHQIKKLTQEQESINLDGHDYLFLSTPGHSFEKDDVSLYMPEKKLLFVGDLAQPQGHSYKDADGVSPVPFFYYGDDYISSLQKLLQLDFDKVITGHGYVMNKQEGIESLSVTRQCIERIRDLAVKITREHPQEFIEVISEWIYDTIVAERNFGNPRGDARKRRNSSRGKSDYELYDFPGIRFFVAQAKESLSPK